MENQKKYRAWCFTINNYRTTDIESVKSLEEKCVFLICGKEIGDKKKTKHLQGYVYFKNPVLRSGLSKILKRARLVPARGSAEQNKTYCSKEGDLLCEFGSLPVQGKRTDLLEIKNEILNGKKVDDITLENPSLYHQYGRTLSKIEDLAMRKKYRTEMTQCDWIYGKTNVGKSHEAFKDFNPETHYVWKNDNGWQDGYTQQETVIINDFRGEIPYNELLQLIDKWPHYLKRRNREPMPFISKKIIITSSLPPEKVYRHRDDEDKIEQLLRRIHVIKMEQKWS